MSAKPLTPTQIEDYTRTVEAAAWLLPIAEKSVESLAWSPELVHWLDTVGRTHFEALNSLKH